MSHRYKQQYFEVYAILPHKKHNLYIQVRLILPCDKMDISITKMSSKGQIVIPAEMRLNIKEGEKLVLIKNKDQLIMKKASDLSKNLEDDLKFAKRTEQAWKRYEGGKFKSMDSKDFLKAIEKW